MGVYAITGSASGIGAAVRSGLERLGHTVIGIDIEKAEIIANLATEDGRVTAIDRVIVEAPNGLDGFIPCAGLGPQTEPWSTIVAVNFYGTVALVEGLKPILAPKQGVVVVISSNSAPIPGLDQDLVESMLERNEAKTCKLVASLDGHNAYAGSKLALTRWMRRNSPAWAREGMRMNAVAPGATMTPLLEAGLEHPVYGAAIRDFPIPTGSFGSPEQIAAMVLFLLGPEATFCNGAVFFVDGGTDAMIRPDSF